MTIFSEIKEIIPNINNAKFQHERFGRERVLAFILQSNGYTDFPFKTGQIGLKGWMKEKTINTTNRIESVIFTYSKPLSIKHIVHTLSTFQPASYCNNLGETRIANGISAMGCGDSGTLFKLFDTMNSERQQYSSRQEPFLTSRNLGLISKNTFEQILQEQGIDPNISRAEIDYFKSKLSSTP